MSPKHYRPFLHRAPTTRVPTACDYIKSIHRQRCQNVDIKIKLKLGVTSLDGLVISLKHWANLSVLGVLAHLFQDRL
jgi:hypothetical protein